MIDKVDQCGERIVLVRKPERIISLVPSLTETICDMGLENNIVGITKFCIHPKRLKKKSKRIGGTKNPKIEKIKLLMPDLIIANKEENRLEDIELMRDICPVYVSDIKTIGDTIRFIEDISHIFETNTSMNLISQIEQLTSYKIEPSIKVCYLIWKKPWMAVGNDSFIHFMLNKYGFINVFDDKKRYPEIDILDIKIKNPDVIMLSSEPYPFKEEHIHQLQETFPDKKIMLVDGELFSWYGSRLLIADGYLKSLHSKFQLSSK